MSETENARARREAMETSSRASTSPNRQRLWAGMNRYLVAETEHALRAAAKEKRDGPEKPPDARPDPS